MIEPFYIHVKGIAPSISLEEAGDSGVDGGGGNHRRGGYDESPVIPLVVHLPG